MVIQELDGLDSKYSAGTITKAEKERRYTLITQAASIRDGECLRDIIRQDHNDHARAQGFPEFEEEPKASKREMRAKAWQQVLATFNGDMSEAQRRGLERRDMTEGVPMTTQIGTYSGLGYFVPTGFLDKIFSAMAMHDALFDPEVVTFLPTDDGKPIAIPLYSDITNVASIVTEASDTTEFDIAAPNHAVIGAFTYKSPRFTVSLEALQDLNSVNLTVNSIFRNFSSDRFARGFATDLINGKVGGPTGLIPEILLSGASIVIAAGSSANDGSASTAPIRSALRISST